MKLCYLIILILILSCSSNEKNKIPEAPYIQDSITIKDGTIKPYLGFPFGTILNIEAIIVDGNSLLRKETTGEVLLHITKVNGKVINLTRPMWFEDETATITASHNFYKLIVYETGKFQGIPNGYFEYRPLKQATGFHFRNYLQIIACVQTK